MDPLAAYIAMFQAMNLGEWHEAQEHAVALKEWLAKGGAYPTGHQKERVDAYLLSVLLRCETLCQE